MEPLPQPPHPDPYTVLERRPIFDSPFIRLREDRFRHRGGGEGRYPVCGFHRTACGVLALDGDDRVVLVGQWRYPHERYSWEIVEGGGDPGESPFDAIRREFREEAGLEALRWEPLSFFHTSNASTDEETFLFLARDLREAEAGDVPEDVEELRLIREPFADCLARAAAGEITDSLTVVALLTLQARRTGVEVPLAPELAERFFQVPARHPSAGRDRWNHLEVR